MITERMYALDLISRSLRLLGVVGAGETAVGAHANQGLDKLHALIDLWRLERLMMDTVQRAIYPLVINERTYTIGPGVFIAGPTTFLVADRPLYIDGAALIASATGGEIPMPVLSDQAYREYQNKGRSSALPTAGIYYAKDFDYLTGRGTLILLERPTVSGLYLVLYLPTSTVQFQDLSTTLIRLPPGYSLALEYNLASLLADNFPGNWTEKQERAASDFKAAIMRVRDVPEVMKCDPMWNGPAVFDILRGEG